MATMDTEWDSARIQGRIMDTLDGWTVDTQWDTDTRKNNGHIG